MRAFVAVQKSLAWRLCPPKPRMLCLPTVSSRGRSGQSLRLCRSLAVDPFARSPLVLRSRNRALVSHHQFRYSPSMLYNSNGSTPPFACIRTVSGPPLPPFSLVLFSRSLPRAYSYCSELCGPRARTQSTAQPGIIRRSSGIDGPGRGAGGAAAR